MEINYTVIIPFRDCTEFLRTACTSIPDRNDIQVVVIDNASEPIGPDIVSDFPNKNLLYLVSSPTRGAGGARNVGIEHALGKYLLFLDADDMFTEDAFNTFDKYVESDYDIVYFNATSIRIPSGHASNRHIRINNLIKQYLSTGNEDYIRYYFENPISKMVKRSLVEQHNIKYQEVPAANDTMFQIWAGYHAKTVAAYDHVVYIITEGDDGSSITKRKTIQNQFSRFKVAVTRYKFMEKIGRGELRDRLISYTLHAMYDFGIVEAFKWIRYAIRNRANPFHY